MVIAYSLGKEVRGWASAALQHKLGISKQVPGAWPGSGAAVMFSTRETREPGRGWYAVQSHVQALAAAHMQHIMVYGSGNDRRLSGCDRCTAASEISTRVVGTRQRASKRRSSM